MEEDEPRMVPGPGHKRPSVPWLGTWTLLIDNGQCIESLNREVTQSDLCFREIGVSS